MADTNFDDTGSRGGKIFTANTSRDTLGVGSILNVNHEGTLKRGPEDRIIRKEEKGKDIKQGPFRKTWMDDDGNIHTIEV